MAVAPRLILPDAIDSTNNSCSPAQLEHLLKVPMFQSLTAEAAERLCGLLTLREYAADTRLFEAGDSGDAMYLIESGRVRISLTDADGREITLSDLREGDFFGEIALIDGKGRSAGATVIEDARLAVLTREVFLTFVMNDQKVMLSMLSAMADRLRRTDSLLRHRVARNANEEDAAHTTPADRAADWIAMFGGSWKFIGFFVVLLCLWIGGNVWLLRTRAFDPYPFVFLNLVLAMITSLQAPIIMMSQNRESQKDRLRADLDYAVNLKNELLLTEIRNFLHERDRKIPDSRKFSGRG